MHLTRCPMGREPAALTASIGGSAPQDLSLGVDPTGARITVRLITVRLIAVRLIAVVDTGPALRGLS